MKTFIKKEKDLKLIPYLFGYSLLMISFVAILKSISVLSFFIGSIVLIFLGFILFYDEIELTKYCHNRRVLLDLIKNNPEKFIFSQYSFSTKMYYFEFEHEGVDYSISYDVNESNLSLSLKEGVGSSLIGYFRSTFTQKVLVNKIISELEKLRGKKV